MTEEDLRKKGRIATALVAGPMVTVGMLGIGAAPAMADEEVEDPETSEEEAEDESTEGDDSDGDDSDGDESEGDDDEGDSDGDDDSDEDDDDSGDTEVAAEAPTQDEAENTVTIPDVEGVAYTVDGEPVSETVDVPEDGLEVLAETEDGYTWSAEEDAPEAWTFDYVEGEDEGEDSGDVDDEDSGEDDSGAEGSDEDDEEGEDEADEADLEEVTPEAPARYDNTVEIPDVEGVTYEVDGESAEPGSSVEIGEDETITVLAVADEGYEFGDDVEETSWSFAWQAGFEDLWPIDPPEDWEVDEDRWYANVPEENLPEGYADWILDLANSANQNADGSQEFESDTQVYAGPGTDSEVLGDAFPTDGAVWWGYLEDEDFWIIVHQYTGAVGFLDADDHLGEQPPGDDLSLDQDQVEPGDVVTVTGGEFAAGEDVEFELDGEAIGTATADDEGAVTTELTIPEDISPGEYTLTATGAESGTEYELALTVVSSDEDPPNGGDGDDDEDGTPPDDDDDDDTGAGDDESIEPFGSFEADVTEVAAGDDVTLTATGLDAGEEVEISLNPTLATVEADEDGEFTVTVTIPEDTEPGEYEITAESLDRDVSATIEITVVEPTDAGAGAVSDSDYKAEGAGAPGGYTPAGGEALAETGADAQQLGLLAGLFTALGAGLVAFAQRAKLVRRKGA